MVLYAATTNQGKLREFAECARSRGKNGGKETEQSEPVDVSALPGMDLLSVPVEDAATFMGNAELKAMAYSLAMVERGQTGMLVMADDSGLEVEALGGRPGVYSARFADEMGWGVVDVGAEARGQPGPESPDPGRPLLARNKDTGDKDARNNACLLAMLAAVPGPAGRSSRVAHFVCALALARDGEVLLRAEGSVSGEILMEPRGANGFGYDPLFLLPERGQAMAELSAEQKWAVSHRGQAFRLLLQELRGLRAR